ncbi:hypothetical protein [Streptomyces sp. NBC_00582]|uniref:hypothetical protein n=1 Tax=Streptomyces sp. NBC_00582 TaxID=2975783 RepID=UPI002E806F2A|nr:hypothetical protein [Streptomyces sp. NBC_00582]WUB61520.1 hypothetical protein OG852_14525 [Streptomyces sp. NBC_00582]
MTSRPRCASGHFIPATRQPGEPCHCALRPRRTRVRDHHDLWGQGRRIQHRTLATVPLAGSYL